MSAPASSAKSILLNLEENECEAFRRLTLYQNHLLAIGGSNGIITAASKDNSASDPIALSFEKVQEYDDLVRALAFSNDGTRIAVGYDSGSVDIFCFTEDQLKLAENNGTHPFFSRGSGKSENQEDNMDEEEEDLFDAMLTQGDDETSGPSGSGNKSSGGLTLLTPSFSIPRFDSEIRSLSFQNIAKSSKSQKYHLAIALESNGFAVVDVTSSTTSENSMYLHSESKTHYTNFGTRHVTFSPSGGTLATIGCNGRAAFWATSPHSSDPELEWEMSHGDSFACIEKKDGGAFADSGDRGMELVWSGDGCVVGIPGSRNLQLRRKSSSENPNDGSEDEDRDWLTKDRVVLGPSHKKKDGEDDTGEIVSIAFDPLNSGYVVTSFRNGAVGVWKLKDDMEDEEEPEGKFIGFLRLSDENASIASNLCTHILWTKNGNSDSESLYLAMENGSMGIIGGRDNIIPNLKTKIRDIKEKAPAEEDNEEEVQDDDISQTQEFEFETQPIDANADEEEAAKPKKRLQKVATSDTMEDSDDDLFDQEDQNNNTSAKNQFVADEAEDDHDIDNLNGDISGGDNDRLGRANDDRGVHFDDNTPAGDDFGDDDDDDDNDDLDLMDENGHGQDSNLHYSSRMPQQIASLPEPQAPFAPSSTPLEMGRRRILCWNQHGVITARPVDGSQRVIDFSFVDSASRRPVSFRDPYNFIVGTIGEEGGLFASDVMEDLDDDEDDIEDDLLQGMTMSAATKAVVKKSGRMMNGGKKDRATGSNIYFHRFDTFGSVKEKDWHLSLPEGERAVGCASGEGWNAVVTSRRFLRMFSTGGMQGPVVWLKGDLVTVVGRGRFLAVIYHEANPLMDGTQKLGYALYDGVNSKLIVEGSVSAISPGSSLMWAGFANDLSLCIMDQDGMVSMLVASKMGGLDSSHFNYKWVPMLDTLGFKKSREDHFWPVSIQDAKFICVPLKGVKHPDATRRPLTTSFTMRVPLARGAGGRSIALDEVSVRANLALENKQFINDFEISVDNTIDAQEVENEYTRLCVQVDKVSLKLYFTLIENGLTERALDVVKRLHNEKSMDVAITAADQKGLSKLSDNIIDLKEERFNQDFDEDNDQYSDDEEDSVDSRFENTPVEQNTANTRRVSPESTKRKVRSGDFGNEDSDLDEDDVSQEKPTIRSRRLNPFAKKLKESPPKAIMDSPQLKKPTLSRMSTFSAQSRQKSKLTKHFL